MQPDQRPRLRIILLQRRQRLPHPRVNIRAQTETIVSHRDVDLRAPPLRQRFRKPLAQRLQITVPALRSQHTLRLAHRGNDRRIPRRRAVTVRIRMVRHRPPDLRPRVGRNLHLAALRPAALLILLIAPRELIPLIRMQFIQPRLPHLVTVAVHRHRHHQRQAPQIVRAIRRPALQVNRPDVSQRQTLHHALARLLQPSHLPIHRQLIKPRRRPCPRILLTSTVRAILDRPRISQAAVTLLQLRRLAAALPLRQFELNIPAQLTSVSRQTKRSDFQFSRVHVGSKAIGFPVSTPCVYSRVTIGIKCQQVAAR